MTSTETRPSVTRNQGCTLAVAALLLACILLVLAPTIYGVSRYRAAQVFAGDVSASGQSVTLPTQQADTYTLTLQPQVGASGGVTVGFTLMDGFGRTLAASTDFYTTGCAASGANGQTCPAQSRDFSFHNALGGAVHLTLQATQPGVSIAVQVRDEDVGGIFASGSLVLFGLVFGCGALLWLGIAALAVVLLRRAQRSRKQEKGAAAPAANQSP